MRSATIGIDASRAVRANRAATENYSFFIISELLKTNPGYNIRLYAPERFDLLTYESEKVRWVIIPQARLWSQVKLSEEIRRHPPDLLFVPSHVIPLLTTIKSVVTVHDFAYRMIPECYSKFDRRYLNFSTATSIAKAAKVIVPSNLTKDDLKKFYPEMSHKTVVIPYGYNSELYQPKLQSSSPLNRPYFLFVGRVGEKKNVPRILEAFEILARHKSDVSLVIAGKSGFGYERVTRIVDRLPPYVKKRVILPGYLPSYDTVRYLQHAAGFVFPSLYEGFGLQIIEAMACGTPVITSSTSALREIAGGAALTVDPTDVLQISTAMSRVLTEPNLSKQLKLAGFERAKQFSWAKAGQETWKVLESAL